MTPWHVIFDRPLTDEEWSAFSRRIDGECWAPEIENWSMWCAICLMLSVAPGIKVVSMGEPPEYAV
jgi:hypothetical protein